MQRIKNGDIVRRSIDYRGVLNRFDKKHSGDFSLGCFISSFHFTRSVSLWVPCWFSRVARGYVEDLTL